MSIWRRCLERLSCCQQGDTFSPVMNVNVFQLIIAKFWHCSILPCYGLIECDYEIKDFLSILSGGSGISESTTIWPASSVYRASIHCKPSVKLHRNERHSDICSANIKPRFVRKGVRHAAFGAFGSQRHPTFLTSFDIAYMNYVRFHRKQRQCRTTAVYV